MKKLNVLTRMLLLVALLVGSTSSVWAAPGDEITSLSNIVSGKWYYLKGIYSYSKKDYTVYYGPATATADPGVNIKVGDSSNASTVTTIGSAMPVLFTYNSTEEKWTLQTPNGYYIRPHSSNGQSYLLEDVYYLTLTSGKTKAGNNTGIQIGTYVNGTKTWYLQVANNAAKIGGYQNTGYDLTLIEAGEININAACNDGAQTKTYYSTYSSTTAFYIPDGMTVSEIGLDSNGKLVVEDYTAGAIVPANRGVLVSSNKSGKIILAPTTGGTSVLGSDNCLYGTGGTDINATAMAAAAPGCLYYRLTMHNDTDLGFYWGAEGGAAFGLAANKAFLAVPESQAKEGFSFISDEEETDGIKAVSTKVENGVRYNLAGQKVGADYKGIVIVNGKKYLNK